MEASHGMSPSDDELVQAALERYLKLMESGQRPEQAEFLAEFSESPLLRSQLKELLDSLDAIGQLLPHYASGSAQLASRVDREEEPCNERHGLPRLGDFQLLQVLGRGGMGIVYKARQISLDRDVAVKVLPLAAEFDCGLAQRFEVEARAAALLDHPHIVPILVVGASNGIHYYAMQFIEGRSVAELLDDDASCGQRQGAYREIANYGSQVAMALQHAHEQGVIHRDVKPANLLLDMHRKIWLTDFGLARIDQSETLTMSGDVLGTIQFMSPEQRAGTTLDHRTDIYSLGATLRHWLHSNKGTSTLARLPKDLETILDKAQAENIEERYPDAMEFARDLERFAQNQPILARPPSWYHQFKQFTRRHRQLALAASIACIAAIALTFSLNQSRIRTHEVLSELTKKNQELKELQYANGMQQAFATIQAKPNRALSILRRQRQTEPGQWRLEHALLQAMSGLPEKAVIGKHDGSANEVAVNANNQAASVGQDGKLCIWDLETLRMRHRIDVGSAPLHSVAWEPKGAMVATGSQAVHLWDMETGKRIHKLTEFQENVESIAFSPDSSRIATAARYSATRVFDQDLKQLGEIESRARHSSLEFVCDGKKLLIPTRHTVPGVRARGTLQIWDRDLAHRVDEFLAGESHYEDYTLAAASPDGRFYLLANFYAPEKMCLRSARTKETLVMLPRHGDRVTSAAVSPSSTIVAAGYEDGSIAYWHLNRTSAGRVTGVQRTRSFVAHQGGAHCVRFASDDRLISCGDDGNVVLWKLPPSDKVITHSYLSRPQLFDVGSDTIAIALKTNVRILDQNGERLCRLSRPHVAWLEHAPSGEELAVMSRDSMHIDVLQIPNGEVDRSLHFSEAIRAAGYSPMVDELAVLTADGQLHFADQYTGKEVTVSLDTDRTFPRASLCYSRSGRFVACAVELHGIYLLDAMKKRVVCYRATDHYAEALAFAGDQQLISGHTNSAIHIWQSPTLLSMGTLEGHMHGGVHSLSLSSDGETLASGGVDGSIRLWRIPTRRYLGLVDQVEHLEAEKTVRCVAIAPNDGKFIFTSDFPRQLTIYDLGDD